MTPRRFWLLVGLAGLVPAAAFAAHTQTFLETNEADFAAGESDGIVWTSRGALRLGRAVQRLMDEAKEVELVTAFAVAPGDITYVASGGAGRVYRVAGEKVDLLAELEDAYLFSAAVDPASGDLYVGSGGQRGRIWRLRDGAEPEVVFEDQAVKYVWGLAWHPDGGLVAATGDQGRVLRVAPDGTSRVLLDTDADHVLALAVGPDGAVYAGTDGEALVYRWTPPAAGEEKGAAFVLYDAVQKEVAALALGADGTLYVGASSGQGARPGGASGGGGQTIQIQMTAPPQEAEEEESFQNQDAGDGEDADEGGDAEVAEDADQNDGGAAEKAAPAAPPMPKAPAKRPAQSMAEKLKAAMMAAARRAAGGAQAAQGGDPGGSAVYRIDREGIASLVFAAPDPRLLSMAVYDGRLLVGTGDDGRLYEIALGDHDEEACLADVDPKQILALAVTPKGRVLAGTADAGGLYALSAGPAEEGTYTSRVYDAGGSARWGLVSWRGSAPDGAEIRLATRTGNVGDPEKGLWSDWSGDLASSPAPIASPSARYIQFRVTMRAGRDAGPHLEQFEAAYLRANEPPQVTAVEAKGMPGASPQAQMAQHLRQMMQGRGRSNGGNQAKPQEGAAEGPQPIRIIQWQATDPNGDALTFDVSFRGQGETIWVPLEEDFGQPKLVWDTTTVADGWYEIRVVASDAPDNPPDVARTADRISDPVLVDNTAPLVEQVETEGRGRDVEVRLTVGDATSRLTGAAYTVDSSFDWRVVWPEDRIFDAKRETFVFTIEDLAPGAHRIAVTVDDLGGNRVNVARTVTIPD